MKEVGKFFSFLWRCWFSIIAILSTLLFGVLFVYPLSFIESGYKKTYFFMRLWGTSVFYLTGLWYKKRGVKLEENQQYIIVANHTSFMDIMLMLAIVKNPMVFVGKAELEHIPIFGRIYRRVSITVDRKNKNSRTQVFRKAQEKIKKGMSICIFPEGGVPDDTSIVLDEFKNGPFIISALHTVPMAVFTICGMKEHMPYGWFTGYPGRIDVFCNEIVNPERFPKKEIESYKNYVRGIMFKQLNECKPQS